MPAYTHNLTGSVFDDEMGLWVRSMSDAALRPRRGGPRFVPAGDRAAAEQLTADPRSNEQLEYDLVMDVLRAGSIADVTTVFGTRQPGVRIVVIDTAVIDTADTDTSTGSDAPESAGPSDPSSDPSDAPDGFGRVRVGHAEDGGDALPGSVIDRTICMNGTIQVTVDGHGNPLNLGREHRLFSTRQRIALAIRDGGCVWPECGRVASYCEAHHIDHFARDAGRTDIDRGVLLCKFHHLLLHNRSWKITRHGTTAFTLHPPPGQGPPLTLTSKAAWQHAWNPPPPPNRPPWRQQHPSAVRFA